MQDIKATGCLQGTMDTSVCKLHMNWVLIYVTVINYSTYLIKCKIRENLKLA